MKNFDDIFSRKAKEAFDNYNADHLAEEGWISYVSKHGTGRKRVRVLPLWARAASIAVLVTIGVLLAVRLNHPKAGEPLDQVAKVIQGNQTESASSVENTTATDTTGNLSGTVSAATTPEITAANTAGQAAQSSASPVITNQGLPSPESFSKNTKTSGEMISAEKILLPPTVVADEKSAVMIAAGNSAGMIADEKSSVMIAAGNSAGMIADEKSAGMIAAGKPAAMNLPYNPAEIRLTGNAGTLLDPEPEKKLNLTAVNSGDYTDIPRERKATTLMTGLSGMMASISDASSISQGVSIGFYVEQQLTRRISVRPGLAMARHSYAVESIPGNPGIASTALGLDYSAPELNGLSGTTTSYDANIDIVSIEVPVNFVFSLMKRQRSNLFVTTGASTVVYLSQHLTGNFNNTYVRSTTDSSTGQVSYESMTTSVQIDSEQEVSDRVDLMGLANFSAGYSLPFGKTSHLVFEPFVQLPVKDLTSLNLRIRYGGLSMKIQF